MGNQSFRNNLRKITLISFIIWVNSLAFAQEPRLGSAAVCDAGKESSALESVAGRKEKDLSGIQGQARLYRNQGIKLQRIGNLDGALSMYQKAVELDPSYVVVYNDLGIIYELKGFTERAEKSYLKSIEIDPFYLSAYSNLALLYEDKRDLDKAAFCWERRLKLGSPDDPWTEKAKQRLADIRLVTGVEPTISEEKNVIGLLKDITGQKNSPRQDNNALVNRHFEKAKQGYLKRDYATAIKEAIDAQLLDPGNKEIEAFIEKVQLRALSE